MKFHASIAAIGTAAGQTVIGVNAKGSSRCRQQVGSGARFVGQLGQVRAAAMYASGSCWGCRARCGRWGQ